MLRRIIQTSKNLLCRQPTRRLFCQLPANSDTTSPAPDPLISLELPQQDPTSLTEIEDPQPEPELLEPKKKIPKRDRYTSMYKTENKAVKALYDAFDAFQETSDKREGLREISRAPNRESGKKWQDFFFSLEATDIEMDPRLSWELMNKNNHGQVMITFMVLNFWTGVGNFTKLIYLDQRVGGKLNTKRSWCELVINSALRYSRPFIQVMPYIYFYVKQECHISFQKPMMEIKNKKYIVSNLKTLNK